MKGLAMKSTFYLLIAALLSATAAHAVTVDGHAYLSGRNSHSNIKVLFAAASPSARTDSVFTDSTGDYSRTLQPGVYNLFFSHNAFAVYPLPDYSLLFDTAIPSITLLPPISGALSGNLGPGDFQVVDSMRVDSGATLTILPGTNLWFEPDVDLIVRGQLIAEGTPTDSILFSAVNTQYGHTWGHLAFRHASDASSLAYCVIRGGFVWYGNRIWPDYLGGGILVDSSSVRVSHCTIENNLASEGGGIAILYGDSSLSVQIDYCQINGNEGSGIYLDRYAGGPDPVIRECAMHGNRGYGEGGAVRAEQSVVRIADSEILQNHSPNGGGIWCTRSQVNIKGCLIDSNITITADGLTGGVHLQQCVGAVMTQCVLRRNAAWWGGGVYLEDSDLDLRQCSIIGNHSIQGSGVYLYGNSRARITSSIIAFGDTAAAQPVYRPYAGAIFLNDCTGVELTYSDLYGNLLGNFAFEHDTVSPPAIEVLALTNARGDSCDTYYNIYGNPRFLNSDAGDFHLEANSPCIDAGDPSLPRDPDGTVADIGAFYFDQLEVGEPLIPHPSSFILSAFPNPFNQTTTLRFSLSRASDARITIYDLTGRAVKTIDLPGSSAGEHSSQFDATGLASGVYFASLRANNQTAMQKLLLLK
jgi:hypothetical protein